MGFRMYRPWEHPRSRVWWFRWRIPARLARFGIVAREIKESLHTKDRDEALIHCAERNLHERAWRDLETGFSAEVFVEVPKALEGRLRCQANSAA
jgi:hypothetical protein